MERYFAYGSNMSTARLRSRCPSAEAFGPALLADHRLTFFLEDDSWDQGGVAGVVPAPGERVEGVVFTLAPDDFVALDAYEAIDDGDYRRVRVEVVQDGRPVETWIYLPGDAVDRYVAPAPRYVAALLEGAREHGLTATVDLLEALA